MKAPDMRSFDEMCEAFQQSDARIERRLSHPDVDERIKVIDLANKFLSNFETEIEKIGIDVESIYRDPNSAKDCKQNVHYVKCFLYEAEEKLNYYWRRHTRSSHCIRSLKAVAEYMDPEAHASLLTGQEWTQGIAEKRYPWIEASCEELKEQLLELEILNCALERGVRRFGISHDRAKAQAS